MATKSRTYLPTDWQLWVYTPVAGKFRLDFSALNGADVLGGATDLGSFQVFPLRIGSIQLDDGQRPDQSVFSQFAPGTMALSAQLLAWSDTTVKELYNGKKVYLTLKNEATNSHPTFGKNTVFFSGFIDSLNIDVDPINKITNLTVTAVDILGGALNVPVSIARTTTIEKYGTLTTALDSLRGTYFDTECTFSLFDSTGAFYETNATAVNTMGTWLADYVASGVILITTKDQNRLSGTTVAYQRTISGLTIAANSKTGVEIPESITSGIVISQDGANVPTAFDLSNSAANYNFGTTSASILSNPTIYSTTLDMPTSQLPNVANKILQYTNAIQPTQVTVRTAQSFQPIVFTNVMTIGDPEYFYPQYLWFNGQEVKTMPTYTGGTYYHMVVGTSHTITPDDWQTTYQLWKGL
jgi:hypothetical protein